MPILPTTTPRSSFHEEMHYKRRRPTYWTASIPLFLRRLFRFPQMVRFFVSVCFQNNNGFTIANFFPGFRVCILANALLMHSSKKSVETKNQWARDDPAFVVILSFLLGGSLWAWDGRDPQDDPIYGLYRFCSGWSSDIDDLAFANRFLSHRHTVHAVEQTVEWAYAFDVHCKAFFPLFLILYIAQFFLMRILTKQIWVCLFLGNSMYLIA
ncbi:13222_t:CDS:2, partial [Dentiscutata heterogama]